MDGIKYLSLEKLMELKLASGLTNPNRLKDLADVQELIRVLRLDRAPVGRRHVEEFHAGANAEEEGVLVGLLPLIDEARVDRAGSIADLGE